MIRSNKTWGMDANNNNACDEFPPIELKAEHFKALYKIMLAVRQLDSAAVAWQRQGLLTSYPPCLGQEAAQVGSAFVLDLNRDIAFPTYREMGVARTLNIDMADYFASAKGIWNGGLYNSHQTRLAPFQAVVAGSVLHAVGWAYGAQFETDDQSDLPVALSYFGDGASSEGDVHEAMNFASALRAPVVFFCQNNGWAISVPAKAQISGGSVAARASGYGMPAYRIDGNDVVAVTEATSRALAYARAGRGPVLIEAVTYRLGPHSTSDDPGRYRRLEDERAAQRNDPINSLAQLLREEAIVGNEFFAQVEADTETEVEKLQSRIETLPARPGRELFSYVYQNTTLELNRQEARWAKETSYE